MEPRTATPWPALLKPTLALVFILALFYLLVHGRDLLYPIALGAMLSFLLYPLSSRFEALGLPRALANVVAIIIGIAVVYGVIWFIHRQLSTLTADMPHLKKQVEENVGGLLKRAGERLGIPLGDDPVREVLAKAGGASGPIGRILAATSNTALAVGLLPVYSFMFLFYRDKFREFLLMSVPKTKRTVGQRIIADVSQVTTRYIAGVCVVVLVLAVLNSVGFMLIGLDNAVLIGLIAAICASIPYFGNVAGYLLAILFTLVTGTPDKVGYVVLQFFIVQFIENNVLTPNIVGNMVRLSPFFIILGVLGGSILWGLPGTFVVVPVLAMMKTTFDHLPHYENWAYLLSDRKRLDEVEKPSKLKAFFSLKKKKGK